MNNKMVEMHVQHKANVNNRTNKENEFYTYSGVDIRTLVKLRNNNVYKKNVLGNITNIKPNHNLAKIGNLVKKGVY